MPREVEREDSEPALGPVLGDDGLAPRELELDGPDGIVREPETGGLDREGAEGTDGREGADLDEP